MSCARLQACCHICSDARMTNATCVLSRHSTTGPDERAETSSPVDSQKASDLYHTCTKFTLTTKSTAATLAANIYEMQVKKERPVHGLTSLALVSLPITDVLPALRRPAGQLRRFTHELRSLHAACAESIHGRDLKNALVRASRSTTVASSRDLPSFRSCTHQLRQLHSRCSFKDLPQDDFVLNVPLPVQVPLVADAGLAPALEAMVTSSADITTSKLVTRPSRCCPSFDI